MGILDFIVAAALISRAKKQKHNGNQNSVAHDPYESGWYDVGDDRCNEYDDAEDNYEEYEDVEYNYEDDVDFDDQDN